MKNLMMIGMVGVVLLVAGSLSADVKTFQLGLDGYTGSDDTSITRSGTLNWGGRTDFFVQGRASGYHDRNALLRFDVSELSSVTGLTISSVTLKLYCDVGNVANDNRISVHEIKVANKDWVEGTSNGVTETGTTCWNYHTYDATSPTSWAGNAGCDLSDTDYEATAMDTTIVNAASAWYEWDITSSVVHGWVTGDNAGLILMSNGVEGTGTTPYENRFYSGEGGSATLRPILEVTYDVPEPATMVLLGVGGIGLLIRRRRRA